MSRLILSPVVASNQRLSLALGSYQKRCMLKGQIFGRLNLSITQSPFYNNRLNRLFVVYIMQFFFALFCCEFICFFYLV